MPSQRTFIHNLTPEKVDKLGQGPDVKIVQKVAQLNQTMIEYYLEAVIEYGTGNENQIVFTSSNYFERRDRLYIENKF